MNAKYVTSEIGTEVGARNIKAFTYLVIRVDLAKPHSRVRECRGVEVFRLPIHPEPYDFPCADFVGVEIDVSGRGSVGETSNMVKADEAIRFAERELTKRRVYQPFFGVS